MNHSLVIKMTHSLVEHRFFVWALSAIIACAGVVTYVVLPAERTAYGLALLAVAYVLSWMGIFFHKSQREQTAASTK
jgi:hypothetical protein